MSKKTKTFQEQLEELESIIEWFDSGDVDIDQAVSKFKAGNQLVENLKKRLSEAENKISEINSQATGPTQD